ncbi:hypothetical protein VKS41_002640 [Umbelopsis sp. WA50703]
MAISAALPKADPVDYPDNLELKFLQLVHRHGERTPVRKRLETLVPSIWNLCDANSQMFTVIAKLQGQTIDSTLKPVRLSRLVETEHGDGIQVTATPGSCFYGQLTNVGRASMTRLGSRLRDIYIDNLKFLPDTWDEKTVYIRSTDYTRTQESVQQLIAGGLYPENKRDESFKLNIRTRDARDDNMFPNPSCKKLRQLTRDFNATVAEQCKPKLEKISERMRTYVPEVSLDSHPSANGILDTLVSAKAHGFKLPPDIDDDLLSDLADVVTHEWFAGAMHNEEIRKLSLGRLMGDIRDRMVRKVNGTDKLVGEENLKMAIYSGHDTTVAPLLIILGVFDMKWPPFSSSILFELFKEKAPSSNSWFSSLWKQPVEQDYYVRVRYQDKIMKLPGCADHGKHHPSGDQSLCTLKAFREAIDSQVPKDWAEECKI